MRRSADGGPRNIASLSGAAITHVGEEIDCVFGNTSRKGFVSYHFCALPHRLIGEVGGSGNQPTFQKTRTGTKLHFQRQALWPHTVRCHD